MVNEQALKVYLSRTFPGSRNIEISKIGSGVQGSGFLVEMEMESGRASYVVKGLFPSGLGHDYPSDRAGVFLLDLEEFNELPRHVRALDVLSEMEDGTIKSIGGGREYYLLMERAQGSDYFNDLKTFGGKKRLDAPDLDRIRAMTAYLADLHTLKKESRTLYWRKLRDTIGHGECLMGVFDTYPDGVLEYSEMAEIEKMCIDWRAQLKPKTARLSRVHGDFHPGNIWFRDGDFILLDRSRGAWGEPADDVTALSINYVFFSLMRYAEVRDAYEEALRVFLDEYVCATGDTEIFSVLAPFFAFRAAVVANPVFYPDLSPENRARVFRFAKNVLSAKAFDPQKVNEYLK